MRLRLALPPVLLAVACLTVPAHGSGVDFASAHEVRGDLGAATGAPAQWAARALRAQAGRLHVDASAFRWEKTRESLVGTHVRGRQYRGSLPVEGTDVLVSAVGGRVVQVNADATSLPGQPAATPVPAARAKAVALAHLRASRLLVPAVVKRLMVPVGDRLVDTYEVSVLALQPALHSTVLVDAATGAVRATRDDMKYSGGTGKGRSLVFDPNPIQHLRNPKLREPGVDVSGADTDLDSPELTAARSWVPIKGVDPDVLALQTRLVGTWVNVLGMVGFASTTGDNTITFDYTRGDPRFEGVMAYSHLDRYQRWLQQIGFQGAKGVNREQQEVVTTRAETYDNSGYFPAEDVIVYGTGGVDDAEDAEVILHEYGHAMQDDQVDGWGATAEGGAMGEGFGDFNAGNYYARFSGGGYYDVCLMEWDSTSYSTSDPTCIRRMDSKKHYPKSLEGEVHADGEMWETYLWNVRSHLKGTPIEKSNAAARLVITSHEFQTPNTNFAHAVAALRTAAKALHHPEYVPFINSEATRIGFKLNP